MTVRILGAGLGRTGTYSLKIAFERLLGDTSHHMVEVFRHPEELPVWQAAAEGTMPDWNEFLAGYTGTCDWPSGAFWPEIAAAFPDAPILLSVRDPESWWTSVSNTIFIPLRDALGKGPGEDPWADLIRSLFKRCFSLEVDDPEAMKRAFVEWNEHVRATADPDRLMIWEPKSSWRPICDALGVPVPDEPFPVTNTTREVREILGLPPV
jgi:hypothetical protein